MVHPPLAALLGVATRHVSRHFGPATGPTLFHKSRQELVLNRRPGTLGYTRRGGLDGVSDNKDELARGTRAIVVQPAAPPLPSQADTSASNAGGIRRRSVHTCTWHSRRSPSPAPQTRSQHRGSPCVPPESRVARLGRRTASTGCRTPSTGATACDWHACLVAVVPPAPPPQATHALRAETCVKEAKEGGEIKPQRSTSASRSYVTLCTPAAHDTRG